MRIVKLLGILVLGLVMSSSVAFAAADTANINATFIIPSWISLTVTANGNIDFGTITGPGTFDAGADTELRVISTRSWDLTEAILWGSSTIPTGAVETTIDRVLVLTPDITTGTWGIHLINVAHSLVITEDDLGYMPEGTYVIVVQYTATTK